MLKRLVKRLMMVWQVIWHYDPSPKVFFYHDVGTKYTPMGTDAETFWKHMALLKQFATGKDSLVCFDDGFRGIWDARERFQQAGITPKVFIAVRLVGQEGYLNWDEIRELQNRYGFQFQCHTWTHQTLVGEMIEESPKAERTEEWYRHELVDSREEIGRQIGVEVDELCFPVGYFSQDVIRWVAEAGYKRMYASFPGNVVGSVPQELDAFCQSLGVGVVPRNIVQECSDGDFKLGLRGGMSVFHNRYLGQHWHK